MNRFIRYLGWIVAVALFAVIAAWLAARPTTPDAFYTPPEPLPPKAGVLLRQEPFIHNIPDGARGWRILYSTTRPDGSIAAASAIVLASDKATKEPKPIIAWTHGTIGVVPGCAPSLLDDPFANVPALTKLLANNWVYVGTDYIGLGTQGPHPYLIGVGQARSALDSVRAARQLSDLQLSGQIVVWGHSQGGNAALWTGILAPTYAPELDIAGIAAFAPATDLPALIDKAQHTPVGRIMSSYLLQAYSETYPDVKLSAYTSGLAHLLAHDMAGRCLADRRALFSVAEAFMVGGTVFKPPPRTGALALHLAQNTPDQPINMALLIAQGMADDLVFPDIQTGFVKQRCQDGQALEYWRYAGRDHLSVVAEDSPLTEDLVQWTKDRFAGLPPQAGCQEQTH